MHNGFLSLVLNIFLHSALEAGDEHISCWCILIQYNWTPYSMHICYFKITKIRSYRFYGDKVDMGHLDYPTIWKRVVAQLREASELFPTPTSFLACKSKHVNLSIHQVLMYLHSRMKLCEVDDSAQVDANRSKTAVRPCMIDNSNLKSINPNTKDSHN